MFFSIIIIVEVNHWNLETSYNQISLVNKVGIYRKMCIGRKRETDGAERVRKKRGKENKKVYKFTFQS